MEIMVLAIAFGASVVGAICGIGGGVIIKPLLDSFGIASVSEISFLSGCTVLSMSCYSVGKALAAKGPVWIECEIDREEKVLPMIPAGGTVHDTIFN